jgi:cytochrome c oxidase subunit 3
VSSQRAAEAVEHHVGHHYADAEQEFTSAKLGFWLFLATEILLFGGLFVAYVVFRHMYPEMFVDAHHNLNRTMGATNTVVLICSSLTMALAVRAAQTDKQKQLIGFLVVTLAFAFVFLVIKYFEYAEKIEHGLLPGFWYNPHAGPNSPVNGNLFFGLYFMMTGLHGVHVLAGIVTITWILVRALKRHFGSGYYTPVELTGMYWHLVDLIWIYLFPLFYLIG